MAGLEERLLGDGGSARSLAEVAVAGAGDESVAVMERRKSFDGRGYEFVQHAVAEGQGAPRPRPERAAASPRRRTSARAWSDG